MTEEEIISIDPQLYCDDVREFAFHLEKPTWCLINDRSTDFILYAHHVKCKMDAAIMNNIKNAHIRIFPYFIYKII